jgi:hypothetical protein
MPDFSTLNGYLGAEGIQKNRLSLCAGIVIFRSLDYGLTLSCQPSTYWAGSYGCANERSVILCWCLQQHPLVFVAAALLFMGCFSLLILCWPRQPAELIAAAVMISHVYGVATWTFSTICGPVLCVSLLYLCWSLITSSPAKLAVAQPAIRPLATC